MGRGGAECVLKERVGVGEPGGRKGGKEREQMTRNAPTLVNRCI